MNAQPPALRLAAEALGTFLFFFLGFNAIAVATDLAGGSIGQLGVASAFGLGLAAAVAALGHVSGGHFDPALLRACTQGWPTSIRTAAARTGIVVSKVD